MKSYHSRTWLRTLDVLKVEGWDADERELWPDIGQSLIDLYFSDIAEAESDAVEAVVKACAQVRSNWDNEFLFRMARGFTDMHCDWNMAVQSYLDENSFGIKAEWLKPGLQEVADLVKGTRKIWVEVDGAFYTFEKIA